MKIIQIVVVEDHQVQGLGEDGQLYTLCSAPASFNRYRHYWELSQGLESLAKRVGRQLAGCSIVNMSRRIESFASNNGLTLKMESSVTEDTVIYRLKHGEDSVKIIVTIASAYVTGSDGSEYTVVSKGGQYV